jgi:hypothetical protein
MAKYKDPNARIKNRQSDLIKNITSRYRVTAREARDIVTAVGTFGKTVKGSKTSGNEKAPVSAIKNLGRQVKETSRAAITGKSGTTSGTFKSYGSLDGASRYKEGTKRVSRKMVRKEINK